MTFGDALAHMKQGKFAWRASWPSRHVIQVDAAHTGFRLMTVGGSLDGIDYHLGDEEILAEDWNATVAPLAEARCG